MPQFHGTAPLTMPTRYNTKKWGNTWQKHTEKGGKGAFSKLKKRKHYSAYWRRHLPGAFHLGPNRSKKRKAHKKKPRKTRKKRKRKTPVITAEAVQGRNELYSPDEVVKILNEATTLVKNDKNKWVPTTSNPNHIKSRCRAAFETAGFKLRIQPSHKKGRAMRTHFTTTAEWFRKAMAQTSNASAKHSERTRRRVKSAYTTLYKAVTKNEVAYRKKKNGN